MAISRIEFPGVEKASIRATDDWRITYHRLFKVSCEVANSFLGQPVTPWDVCFLEDLLQVENLEKQLLLDVGWFPETNPSGSYRLRVIRINMNEGGAPRYDWKNPIVDFRTRSIDELLSEIHRLVSGPT